MLKFVMHAAGVLALIGMGGVSFWILASEIIPNRRRIMAAYLAAFVPPVDLAEIVEEQLVTEAARPALRLVEEAS